MAATGAKMAKSQTPRKLVAETRNQAVVRRMAELIAQRDWSLVQAGRSLHDDLGQVLTAAGIQFDLLAQEVSRDHPEFGEKLTMLQGLLEECQVRTRVISQQMNRSTVDRVGLKSALERVRDRWEPGFGGFLSVDCPSSIRPAAGVGRAVVAMTEHALELACNRSTCTRAEIEVAARGQAFEAIAYLQNVVDPFLQIDEEVRWHVVRGACQLAGGEAHIELASDDRQGTILRAHFV